MRKAKEEEETGEGGEVAFGVVEMVKFELL